MPDARLALKPLGKGTGMDWQSVRGRFFHKTATPVRLYRGELAPYHGIYRPSGRLVTFAYVVVLSDNRETGYNPRTAGTDRVRSVIRSA